MQENNEKDERIVKAETEERLIPLSKPESSAAKKVPMKNVRTKKENAAFFDNVAESLMDMCRSLLVWVARGVKWVMIDNFAYIAGCFLIITGFLTLSTSLETMGGQIEAIGLTAFIQLNVFSVMLVMFGLTWIFISQSQTIVTDEIEAMKDELSKKLEIIVK